MNHYPTTKTRGFTLTETSMAAALVSFTLLPLVGMMAIISEGDREVRNGVASLNFVETISQTLRPNESAVSRFKWHFDHGAAASSSVIIEYPQAAGDSSTTIFVGDTAGRIVRSVSEGEYGSGLPSAAMDEAFLIRSTISRSPCGVASALGAPAGLEVEISVESPVDTTAELRDSQIYRTRLL